MLFSRTYNVPYNKNFNRQNKNAISLNVSITSWSKTGICIESKSTPLLNLAKILS